MWSASLRSTSTWSPCAARPRSSSSRSRCARPRPMRDPAPSRPRWRRRARSGAGRGRRPFGPARGPSRAGSSISPLRRRSATRIQASSSEQPGPGDRVVVRRPARCPRSSIASSSSSGEVAADAAHPRADLDRPRVGARRPAPGRPPSRRPRRASRRSRMAWSPRQRRSATSAAAAGASRPAPRRRGELGRLLVELLRPGGGAAPRGAGGGLEDRRAGGAPGAPAVGSSSAA